METQIQETRRDITRYDEYEQLKRDLMLELILFFNGDTTTADAVADDLAYSSVYA